MASIRRLLPASMVQCYDRQVSTCCASDLDDLLSINKQEASRGKSRLYRCIAMAGRFQGWIVGESGRKLQTHSWERFRKNEVGCTPNVLCLSTVMEVVRTPQKQERQTFFWHRHNIMHKQNYSWVDPQTSSFRKSSSTAEDAARARAGSGRLRWPGIARHSIRRNVESWQSSTWVATGCWSRQTPWSSIYIAVTEMFPALQNDPATNTARWYSG